MPLIKVNTQEAISQNIARLIREGYPDDQAKAIAYRVARDEEDDADVQYTGMASDLAAAGVGLEHVSLGKFAFDRGTVRRIDADGRMHVAKTNISKANICPYYGYEIPGAEALGLDPQKKYMLLRDPEELAKAASTFNNIPLLCKHIEVNADSPQKESVVGATGSQAEFQTPYLKNSLVVWDSSSIAGINTGEQRELSAAYRYAVDMTPGKYWGQPYDGRMTNIVGNHVALVPVGRAGADVLVSDSLPKGLHTMKLSDKAAIRAAVGAYLLPQLAQDSATDELTNLVSGIDENTTVEGLAQDAAKAFPDAKIDAAALERSINFALAQDEGEKDDSGTKVEIEVEEEDDDEDEYDEDGNKVTKDKKKAKDTSHKKTAMDAATVESIRSQARQEAMAAFSAVRKAEADVRPLVGEVAAMDSAEDVYQYALDKAGVDYKGVHPSAYPALVSMAKNAKPSEPKPLGMDSAHASDFSSRFPTANKPMKV